MMATAVPTALTGVMATFGTLGIEVVDEDRAAAEEAIGPGSGEAAAATGGLLSFLADNCRRVLTTVQSTLCPTR